MLAVGFIEYVEETTWLSPIVGIPKKNDKLGGFYMEGDVVWIEKWTFNILEGYYQNIQRIFGQFYEDISR